MYVDNELIFEEGWDLGTSATTDYASGCINLGAAARDVGKGRPMYAVIVVSEAFSPSSTSGTVTFSLVEESDTTIDGSSVVLSTTEAFTDSGLTLGHAPIVIPVPPGVALQYLGLKVTWTQDLSSGKVDAFLTLDPQTNP